MSWRFHWFLALFALGSPAAGRAEMVVISEIMYHPPGAQPEYFVLYNHTATPFDIANWRVTEGVSYEFPDFSTHAPAATFLKAFERIVVSSASAAETRAAYKIPDAVRVFGPWSGKLSNEGERLTVRDKNGVAVCTVKYGNRSHWPPAANGTGHSLVLKNPDHRLDDGRNWTVSTTHKVAPGLPPEKGSAGGAAGLRLNEIHFTGSNQVDWVELYNPLADSVAVDGLYISARRDFSDKTPLAGSIAAHSWRSWDTAFALEGGEVTLYLINANNAVLDCHLFGKPKRGEDWQALPDGAGEWFSSVGTTRDSANRPARSTNIVINEIMFDPPFGAVGEFVELFNRGEAAADLSGWAFEAGIEFKFPEGTKMAPGGFLVVAKNAAWLRSVYGDIAVVGNFAGKLSHNGELIRLADRWGNLANEVDYHTGGDWPALTCGGGSSLELIHPWMDNGLASAWRASDESAKDSFRTYSGTNTYLQLKAIGEPSDYQELHLHLVGDGHVVLRNIALLNGGTNYLVHGTRGSTNGLSDSGWLCQGTHWASFVTNNDLHIVADGRGDTRANHVEIDLPGLQRGATYEWRFDARWVSGKPRLIAQSWDHSMADSFLLAVPKNLGTPGRANSRLVPAPAPQVEGLSHSPAVPRSTNTVRITARVSSTTPLASVQLFHRRDTASGDAAWLSQPMYDDGIHGGDALASDGTYSAESTSYKTSGQVVQFHVRATAQNGQSSHAPREGGDHPAMYVVDDRVIPGNLRTERLIVSAYDLGAIAQGNTARYGFRFPRLSNHYYNLTFISNEEEIYYGGEVRHSGSPLTRGGDLHKAKFKLPADHPYRGRTKFGYDDDAAEGKAYHNRVVRYLLYLLGQPANENEFVRVMVNAGQPELREDTEPVDNEFLDRNFSHGSHGELYRIDDEWWFLDNGEGVNQDADWTYRGSDNAGRYRNAWMKRTRETEDDFSNLIAFFKAASNTNASAGELDRWLDPVATAKLAAVRGFIGDWDNFTMRRGRNGYFYRRPGDGLFQFLHWDSDEGFITGQPLYGDFIRGWLEKPAHQQVFEAELRELIRLCAQEPGRFKAWLEAEREAAGGSVFQADYLNFFRVRAREVVPAIGGDSPKVRRVQNRGVVPSF